MNKSLHAKHKSPTRGARARNGLTKNLLLPFLLLLTFSFGLQQKLMAQTTTITTAGTGFDAANGLTGNSFITFAIENTNTYDIILTGVDNFWKTGNTGTIPSLWYTSTSLSGPFASPNPGIAAPYWTNIMTGTPLTVATNGFMPSFTNLSFVIPAGAQYRFALQSTVGISYSGSGAGTPNPNTFTTAGVSLKVHDAKIATLDVGYSGAFPTSTNGPRSFTGQIHFQPASPCVAPPTGGQATASVTTICPNTNFNLSLTGASGGMGMTYQWQTSANGTTGWTNVTGATNANVTVTQTTTSFYRAALTCSGQTANSLPVQVTTNATPTSGTFTINKNGGATATNFISFAAAIASIECGGVNGPIVFNVVAGTGPYNEQVVIPTIPGASATNTVTFNGNGNTLANSATSGATLQLNGADFIRVNNLTIETEATATGGQVVHLTNGADNNIFTGNTIRHVAGLTSTSTSYGVYIFTGSNNNNTFQNNTILGAYYGIYNVGTSAAIHTGNQFIGNTLRDQYIYGIYNGYSTNALIESNDISRPTRTTVSSMYGITLSTGTTGTLATKNRIHNSHGAASSKADLVYALYVTGADAPTTAPNVFTNNLVYDIMNTGTVYGIYTTGADGSHFYNNTIDINNPANTGTVRGFYQLTAATDVRFINNIISINSGATGVKHGIYFGTTTSAITSNNNVFWVNGGTSASGIGYYTTNRVTLADWRTASSQDANSVNANPMFASVSTGNLQPTSGAVNNIGQPIATVTQDITGATRSTTTPDPGAYEFTPAANDAGVIAITSPISGCGMTAQETIVITIQNFGSSPMSNFPVSYTINGGPAVTETYSGTIAPGATASYSFTTKANLGAAGTYTIVAQTALTGDALAVNDSFTKVVTAIQSVTTFPYFQNFENGAGSWTTGGTTSSWVLGTPAGTVINSAASGTNAWKTTLSGTYNNNEQSYVQGPCFNLSSLVQPIITLKIWWNSENNYDKAALQSSIDGGATWQHVGAFGDPNNWYNNNSTLGPGINGVQLGWSGRNSTSNGSNGWLTAKHALTGLGGQSSVLLRIAFGTDGSGVDDGFAFDDVSIFESPANDVGIVALTSPVLGGCGFTATENVCVTITNFGSAATTTFPISYQIGTNPAVTETVTTPIAPGATITYCFTAKANLATGGSYNFTFTTNLTGDGDPSNNTLTRTIVNPLISTFPHIQDFQTATPGAPGVLPSGWTISPATGFRFEIEDGQPTSGTTSGPATDHTTGNATTGRYVYTESSTGATGDIAYLNSPCIDLNGLGSSPGFDFWYHMHGATTGTMEAQVSSNGGTTWTTLATLTGPQQMANTDPWLRRTVSLAGYTGIVQVRFKGTRGSSFTSDMAIDDVKFYNIGAVDLGITSFTPLTKLCGFGTNEQVQVMIDNFGGLTATGFTMSYTVDGGAPVTQTFTGSLAPTTPTTFTFNQGADLSAPGLHTIVVTITGAGDPNATNNTITYAVSNASFSTIPPVFNFETAATGINAMRLLTNPKSAITEGTAASQPLAGQPATSTKGMIMDGTTATGWTIPGGAANPWIMNPDHLSAAYICFSPAGGSATDPLWLSFDLKQTYKTANANTNFRVTVDGVQVGPTYRPPFNPNDPTTPIEWKKIYVDLSLYKNNANIQVGLESSVSEPYANGTGPANLIDNIRILRSNPTGIKNSEFQSSINVYPNPSNGLYSISVPTAKAYTLEVTDLTGRVVKTEVIRNSNQAQLDLKGQAQGVYLLKITSEGASAVQKLILE